MVLVKEHLGMLKAANSFDVYDPESQHIPIHADQTIEERYTVIFDLYQCQDDKIARFETQIARFEKPSCKL